MQFSKHQSRLWRKMIGLIAGFRTGKLFFFDLVNELEGALYAGEFKDQDLIMKWYDFWTPLEILNATKGNSVTLEDADKYLLQMEVFLEEKLIFIIE